MPVKSPESPRAIALNGQRVDYLLRRSNRRSIGLSIDQRGLRVAAPLRATLRDVENLIQQHANWVLDKLAEWRERPATTAQPVTEGLRIFTVDRWLTVKISAAIRARGQIAGEEIQLAVPATVDPAEVLKTTLKHAARRCFTERLAHYAPRLGVPPPPLRLSSARTRWGSCSASGGVSLNWRLILLPLPIIDYVVCHELAHLKEMNHSPRFWSVVGQLCPNWQQRRLELRQLGRELPQF